MTSRLSYQDLGLTQSITPDLMTLGNWFGGEMSFGAFGERKDIMWVYDPRSNQLSNIVITMNAGIAGNASLHRDDLERLNRRGAARALDISRFLERFNTTGKKPIGPMMGESSLSLSDAPPKIFVNGVGSLNIHISGSEKDSLQERFWHRMVQHGICVAQGGFIADHHSRCCQIRASFTMLL